jgi:hypothetical protein
VSQVYKSSDGRAVPNAQVVDGRVDILFVAQRLLAEIASE